MPNTRDPSRRPPSKQRRRHEPGSAAKPPDNAAEPASGPEGGGALFGMDGASPMHDIRDISPRMHSPLVLDPKDFHSPQDSVAHRQVGSNSSLYIPPLPAPGSHAPYAAYKLHMQIQRGGGAHTQPIEDAGGMTVMQQQHALQGMRHGGRHGPSWPGHMGGPHGGDMRRGAMGGGGGMHTDMEEAYPLAAAPRGGGRGPAPHGLPGGQVPVMMTMEDMRVDGGESVEGSPEDIASAQVYDNFLATMRVDHVTSMQTDESLSFLAMGQPEDGSDGPGFQALLDLARENMALKQKLRTAHMELTRLQERVSMHQTEYSQQQQKDQESQSRYWTVPEHQRFLEAIQNYGPKDVKMIAAYVGTRNVTQVRTHAQKYFIKLARQNKSGNDGDNSSSGEASTCSNSNIGVSSSSTNFETGPSNSDSTSSNMSGKAKYWYDGGNTGGLQSSSNSLQSSASPENSNSSSPFNKEEAPSSGSEGGERPRKGARGWARGGGGGGKGEGVAAKGGRKSAKVPKKSH